jgi:hypothetical protein
VKTFLYWSLVGLLVAALFVVSILYYNVEELWSPRNVAVSRDNVYIITGDHHLFQVTHRAFNISDLDGYSKGAAKWTPVGGDWGPFDAHFVSAADNTTILDNECVIGVVSGDTATAYPIRILATHQVINDTSGERPVLVYFSDFNHTAAAFAAEAEDKTALSFASSGFLVRKENLLFDRSTESLFLPTTGTFVAGKRLGERLEILPSGVMTLQEWLALYPQSRIMSTNTAVVAAVYDLYDLAAKPEAAKTAAPDKTAGDLSARRAIVVSDGWRTLVAALPSPDAWQKGEKSLSLSGKPITLHLGENVLSAYVTDESGKLVGSLRSMAGISLSLVSGAETVDLAK